jgi:transposase InsO family protein
VGWEYLHLAIDDHSRLAYSEILPDEKRASCLRFLFNALRFFRSLGVKVQRVMTDNGVSFRSFRYAKALHLLRIKHLRTKPYTPRTNGKAERFVQTSLREWASAQAYPTSAHRARSSRSGFTATTGIDLMAVSDQSPQSADLT